ncbi:ATP-binding protein [Patescibacteria group bacterium]|nr:ATP-binding protein [Patescibacteria group bacterium]
MQKIIKRQILSDLEKHLNKKEITLIVGARQVGKTTLMKILEEKLKKENKKTIYLNLDIENDNQYFISQNALVKKLELEFGKNKSYVFIDEIQRKENAGLFLKGIFDLNLPYKFIVSGSGSLELKEKIHESLAGRKQIFQVRPVSFYEFVNFKTNYKYEDKLDDFWKVEKHKTQDYLEEYLSFGGYPRVILEQTLAEKTREIAEIYQSYLERDINQWLNVEKNESFNLLVKALADQSGNLVNYSELSNTLNISHQTVKKYLWYLEKTFIVNKVTPFFKNIRKEISKAPIFYFSDLGLKNYVNNKFGQTLAQGEKGFLFENFIFNILKQELDLTNIALNFWRTKDGSEVDLIVNAGKKIIPLEVKYQKNQKPKIERSLQSFINKYSPEIAFIVNRDLEQTILIKQTKVKFLSFYDLLTEKII